MQILVIKTAQMPLCTEQKYHTIHIICILYQFHQSHSSQSSQSSLRVFQCHGIAPFTLRPQGKRLFKNVFLDSSLHAKGRSYKYSTSCGTSSCLMMSRCKLQCTHIYNTTVHPHGSQSRLDSSKFSYFSWTMSHWRHGSQKAPTLCQKGSPMDVSSVLL